ncbi:(-)-germacrene D synthase-like [Cucurbita pepo subsp. pepo]|uniref:(-)-germacrene D synthase-like n=1 Tax=Cucurbita pepo subsp. pepo TaxID=3664 RepID=UPI000C9D4216|nr:(-)-germacrene D synthase-like [Cucurbita pepo subsp. pepo]
MASKDNTSLDDGVVPRRFANFPPSAWGDFFISYDSNTMLEEKMVEKQLQKLKEEVMNMFVTTDKSSEKLRLIDSIQRLGLSHHFQLEINETLQLLQSSSDDDDDIYNIALKFRLLRQEGYSISSEIFNKFINEEGEFKESIVKDKSGILSLYEASHLRMNGEYTLDKALRFTTTHLQEMAMDESSPLVDEAKHALKWPIYKTVPRLMTKHYISVHQKDPPNSVLLTFAKLDYTTSQKLYQKELGQHARWWKQLNLIERLSFARDRAVESYFWALGVYYEPNYSVGRMILAKIIALATVLDDMYDVYATLDELDLFTEAIERWDTNCMEKLPEYMKIFYEVILKTYEEFEEDMSKDIINYAINYAKEAFKRQCRVYFMEAKWYHEGYVPSMEEYMKVSIVSTCYYLFAPISFLGMGVAASEEAFKWVESDPMMLKASGIIGRLMNDITSHKFDQERGDVGSAVECYMKQHGVSEEETLVALENEVVRAWKDVVEDYMKSSNISKEICMRVLNLARLSDRFYKEEDGYTFADGTTKCFIASTLVDPVPI